MFSKFHNWYDEQRETQRFLITLVLAAPVIMIPLWMDDSPIKSLVASAYICLLLIPRVLHLHKGRTK